MRPSRAATTGEWRLPVMDRLGQLLVVQPGKIEREHLFKDSKEWEGEIHILWERVENISGERNGHKEWGKNTLRNRKGI